MRTRNYINVKKYAKKRAMIGRFSTLDEVAHKLEDWFVVKIGGIIFTAPGGEYKWKTREEAVEARKEIKKSLLKS